MEGQVPAPCDCQESQGLLQVGLLLVDWNWVPSNVYQSLPGLGYCCFGQVLLIAEYFEHS